MSYKIKGGGLMKKVLLALCGVFFLCSVVPQVSFSAHKDMDKSDVKEKLIKDKSKYVAKLDALLAKYESAGEKDKESIKKEVKKLVKSNLDKSTAFKQAIIEQKKKIIEKLEKELADIKADKDKYIDDKVDFLVSPEGIAKTHDKALTNKN
jgi:hypothetical protein